LAPRRPTTILATFWTLESAGDEIAKILDFGTRKRHSALMLTLIDPNTLRPFPSAVVSDRRCFAIPYGSPFAVKIDSHGHSEAVISVDGRDVLTNVAASPQAMGVQFNGTYICKGFQVSLSSVQQFIHRPAGRGLLTAERAYAPENIGLVAVAVYGAEPMRVRREPSLSRSATRGGTAAGDEIAAPLVLDQRPGTRNGPPKLEVVEYDTHEGWAARGVSIAKLSDGNPWPAMFSDRTSL
jgi:hypothetical protein